MNKTLDFTNLAKIINKHSLFLFRYWQWIVLTINYNVLVFWKQLKTAINLAKDT